MPFVDCWKRINDKENFNYYVLRDKNKTRDEFNYTYEHLAFPKSDMMLLSSKEWDVCKAHWYNTAVTYLKKLMELINGQVKEQSEK